MKSQIKAALELTAFRLLAVFLIIITFAALLPWQPQGPFDARNYHLIEGVSLSYPWWGILLEPLYALGQILIGAPDFRLTLLFTALWFIALAIAIPLWRARRDLSQRHRIKWAVFYTGIVLVLYFAYIITAGVVYFPGWKLEVDNPDWLVVDLQSHTIASHDGLVMPEKSLSWHRDRGYDLFAVTEHDDPAGAFAIRTLADKGVNSPIVIPAVEVNDENEDYILGIGLRNTEFPKYAGKQDTQYSRRFVENIHQQHQGATIALSWGLPPERVSTLVASGIDAFEIANTGHPDIPDDLRTALLDAAEKQGVVLVASSDWHGWGGFSRSWTLVHMPEAKNMNREQIAARTVQLLRQHKQEAFVPVAAGYMGDVPWVRTFLSPFMETLRYGAELSIPRVIMWWIWFAGLIALFHWLRVRGLHTGRVLLGTAGSLLGLTLLWRAMEMHGWWPGYIATEYSQQIGTNIVWVGMVSLILGIGFSVPELWRYWQWRKGPRK